MSNRVLWGNGALKQGWFTNPAMQILSFASVKWPLHNWIDCCRASVSTKLTAWMVLFRFSHNISVIPLQTGFHSNCKPRLFSKNSCALLHTYVRVGSGFGQHTLIFWYTKVFFTSFMKLME